MAYEPEQRQKIPLIFFRTSAGSELVREWLKERDRAPRHRYGPVASAMALADRHAALPRKRKKELEQ
jgi:hypothetical protein